MTLNRENAAEVLGYPSYDHVLTAEEIVIPEGITVLEMNLFSEAEFKKVTLPESLTEICTSAFRNCAELEGIVIPNSVIYCRPFSFFGCRSLEYVKLSKSLLRISMYTFNSCVNLREINIPDSVKSIGCFAFCGCMRLKHVRLPNDLVSVDHHAFSTCENLESISASTELAQYSPATFEGCRKRIRVQIRGIKTQGLEDGYVNLYLYNECVHNMNLPVINDEPLVSLILKKNKS